jgi:hypothetical protein
MWPTVSGHSSPRCLWTLVQMKTTSSHRFVVSYLILWDHCWQAPSQEFAFCPQWPHKEATYCLVEWIWLWFSFCRGLSSLASNHSLQGSIPTKRSKTTTANVQSTTPIFQPQTALVQPAATPFQETEVINLCTREEEVCILISLIQTKIAERCDSPQLISDSSDDDVEQQNAVSVHSTSDEESERDDDEVCLVITS